MLRKTMAPNLERSDRLRESVSLFPVIYRVFERALHFIDSAERGRYPFALEIGHRVIKPPVQFTQQIFPGDAAVIEKKLRGIRRQISDLFELLTDTETGGFRGEQDQ